MWLRANRPSASLSRCRSLAVSGCLAALIAPTLACQGSSDPPPTKVEAKSSIVERPKRPERKGPFRHPDTDPPPERSGEQLAEAELEQTLSTAATHIEKDDKSEAIRVLRKCANKVPASSRCEGELAMLLWAVGRHRAEARYFFDQAGQTDDPKADVAFYRRLVTEAQKAGRNEAAANAAGMIIARGAKTADDYAVLSRTLQGVPARVEEAIAALEKAYAADSKRHDLLYERAVLVGQSTETQKALDLFKQYLAAAKGQDAKRDSVAEARIAELEAMLKQGGGTKTKTTNKPG